MANSKNFLVFIAGLLLSTPASAGADPRPAAERKPARIAGGGSTRAGFLLAGRDGAAWRFPGGARLRAEPGAELRVLSSPQSLVLAGGRRADGYTVIVRAGHVDVELESSEPSSSAVILALPGRFNAIVQGGSVRALASGGAGAIAVAAGLTTASVGGGHFRPVAPGSIFQSNSSSPGQKVMIKAPQGLRGGGIWLSIPAQDDRGSRRELEWDSVPDARGYRIELTQQGGHEPLSRLEVQDSRVSARFPPLAAGAYELHLYARDALGFASAAPLRVPIRVLDVSVPPGGYVDAKGVIRLAPRQKLRVLGADGVEMTYGNDGHYFRARGQPGVGLFRGEPTFVHFRLSGSHEVSTLKLAPRSVRARVDVGPKTVTWPARPVEIQVHLVDDSGEPIPEWIEMVPRVTLGIDELDVKFRQDGRSLRARVAPQLGPGPWVVRVEVADQFGLPLGRDFVEVIRGAGPNPAPRPVSCTDRATALLPRSK